MNVRKLTNFFKAGYKYESTENFSSGRWYTPPPTNASKAHRLPQFLNRKTPERPSKDSEAISKEPQIQREAKTVKEMVGDYLEIVHIIMRDQVPKYIMFSLVQALQNYLKYDILNDLLERHPTKNDWEKLVQWEESDQVAKL